MKKISRSRRRFGAASGGGGWYRWAFVALLILAVLLARTALAGLLWRAVAPLAVWQSAATDSQVAALQAQLASTTAALADRNLLQQENLELKAVLGRAPSQSMVLAGVLLRPPATPYDTLMLDAGQAQGVALGDQVSAGGETVIGTIAQVYPTTSRAVLFSAPGQSFNALLTPGQGAAVPITVVGQGSGSMTSTVPAGTPAAAGELVVFPGVAGGLPASVSAVVTKEGDSFETLYLQLPVNPLMLRFVEILK